MGGVRAAARTPECASSSHLGTFVPRTLQPFDQHRVGTYRSRKIDHRIQQLIVPGRAQSELRADRFFLRAGMAPPPAFELQDAFVAFAE